NSFNVYDNNDYIEPIPNYSLSKRQNNSVIESNGFLLNRNLVEDDIVENNLIKQNRQLTHKLRNSQRLNRNQLIDRQLSRGLIDDDELVDDHLIRQNQQLT